MNGVRTMDLMELALWCQPYDALCYSVNMEIINFPTNGFQQVGSSGVCPHCSCRSYFKPVTAAYQELIAGFQILCNAAQCEACKNFALVVGERNMATGRPGPFMLKAFYPLGRPNDTVDLAVPKDIAGDFREALRCRWVEAYKAAV